MLLALVSVPNTAGAEEVTRDARIEATIPQSGNVMGVGFDSVWMMNLATNKLIRIHPDDNSVTEIPILGTVGPFANAGLALGEGAVWVPDHGRSMIYKIDPKTNRVVKEIPGDLLGGGALGPRAKDGIGIGEGAVWAIADNKELRRNSAEGGNQEAAVSYHPTARASSSPSAPSGSRGQETTNSIALIRPPTRSLRQSTSIPIRVPW
jgi:streptogramin lyase